VVASEEDKHLMSLLPFENQKPWIVQLFDEVRDALFPPKQPPLLVTSKPLPPKDVRAGIFIYAGAGDVPSAGPAKLDEKFLPGVTVDSEHLDRLAQTGEEIPWYTEFYQNIKDTFFPSKQPPLKVTSKPVSSLLVTSRVMLAKMNWL